MSKSLPILYENNTTVFGGSNGIGVLSDCVECYVNETLNEEFELVLKYPVNGVLFSELTPGRIIYAKPSPSRSAEAFRIYRFNKVIRDTVEFSARHISYDLSGVIIKPITSATYRPSEMLTKLNTASNYYRGSTGYTFLTDSTGLYPDYDTTKTYNTGDYVMYPAQSGTSSRIRKCKEDNVTGTWNNSKWDEIDNSIKTEKPMSLRSIFGTGENTLLGAYGGEFKYVGYNIYLIQSRGEDRGVSLRYGINLVDANQEKNIAEMYTGVLPFYSSSGTVVIGSTPIIELVSDPPFENVLALDVTGDFTAAPSQANLTKMGQKYIAINEYGKPKVSISVKQPDLTNFEYSGAPVIELGDKIRVYYEKLGISEISKVVHTSYDVLNDTYKEIEIGDVKNTIVRTIAKQTSAITTIVNNYGGSGSGGGGGTATAVFG